LSGSSSPIGRVAVSSPEVDALLRRQQFPGERLEEILAWDGAEDIFAGLVDRYILRAGISGVQPNPRKHLGQLLRAGLSACFIWWAHTDSNRGPKDYELPRN